MEELISSINNPVYTNKLPETLEEAKSRDELVDLAIEAGKKIVDHKTRKTVRFPETIEQAKLLDERVSRAIEFSKRMLEIKLKSKTESNPDSLDL